MNNLLKSVAIVLLVLLGSIQSPVSAAGQTTYLPAGSTAIRSLAYDGNGRLWVATFGNGLWVIDASGCRRFFDAKINQPFSMVNNLLLSDNRLYIATAGGGCVRLNCDSLEFEPLVQHPGFAKLHGLFQTASDTVFIGSVGSGTACLRDETWVPVTETESIQLTWVNSIVEWENKLWLGTSTGLYANSADSTIWKPQFAGISRAINCLLAHENILYAGTTDRGVYAIKSGHEAELISGTMGQIQFLTAFNGQIIAGGELGLWSIKDVNATDIVTDLSGAKCATVDPKKFLRIGTMDGKIYSSVDAKHFSLTFAFIENSLQEQK